MVIETEEEEGAGLDSDDPAEILEAAEAIVADLRSGILAREDVIDDADRFFELATHDDPFIRQIVAEACLYLPDEQANEALELLIKDNAGYVARRAAKVSADRAVNKKKRARSDERAATIQDLLDEIGDAPPKHVKPLAERLVKLSEDSVANMLDHEIGKAATLPQFALTTAKTEIQKPAPDLAVLAAKIDTAIAGFQAVLGVAKAVLSNAATLKATFTPGPLEPDIREAVTQLEARLGERRARTEIVLDLEPNLALEADRTLLKQALANLFDNAVEAYGTGEANSADAADRAGEADGAGVVDGAGVKERDGRIHLHVSARAAPGSFLRIDVSDRGVGMSEEQIAELEGRYTSTKPGGSGVGYRMVRKIVEEAHGGEVAIESRVGVGTTMTLRFPAKQAGMRKARAKRKAK